MAEPYWEPGKSTGNRKITGYKSIRGKTYSLFGENQDTSPFYQGISDLTDKALDQSGLTLHQLWIYIQSVSRHRYRLKRSRLQSPDSSMLASILHQAGESLSGYITGLEDHLRSAPLYKHVTDRSLLSSREQYYLYMIEFELVNRMNRKRFLASNYRIAMMPYCLRETQTECRASPDTIDYVCKECLKTCQINKVSRVLKENNVAPYIWRTAKLKPLFRNLIRLHGNIGVLGIACMVELVRGMRLCMQIGLPVVGIPLNANRCIRWMDRFYDTSVDMKALESIL